VSDIETPVTHPDYSIESLWTGYLYASHMEDDDGNLVLKKGVPVFLPLSASKPREILLVFALS